MKTGCDREAVALLATGAVSENEAAPIRRHLATCATCRTVYAEFQAVAAAHAGAARNLADPAPEAVTRVERRIATAIRARPARRNGRDETLGWWRRVAAALALAAVIAVGFILAGRRGSRRPASRATVVLPSVPPPPARREPAGIDSRWAAYRLALNDSPEALDRRLTEEAARRSEPPPESARSLLARWEPEQ